MDTTPSDVAIKVSDVGLEPSYSPNHSLTTRGPRTTAGSHVASPSMYSNPDMQERQPRYHARGKFHTCSELPKLHSWTLTGETWGNRRISPHHSDLNQAYKRYKIFVQRSKEAAASATDSALFRDRRLNFSRFIFHNAVLYFTRARPRRK